MRIFRSAPIMKGFTLVEFQVALLLLALIAVVMVSSLRLGMQTWDKVNTVQDTTERRYLLAQALRRQLTGMRFAKVRTIDSQLIVTFFGSEQSLSFVAPFPTFENDNVLYWWTLSSAMNDETEHYELTLSYIPFSPEEYVEIQPDGTLVVDRLDETDSTGDKVPGPPPGDPLVLARDVILKEAKYLYRDESGRERWLTEWQPQEDAPVVVSLELAEVGAEGEETLLPPILVSSRYVGQWLSPQDGPT